MRRELAAVRIFPMSDKAEGFVGCSTEDVQRKLFLRELPRRRGRYQYRKSSLVAEPNTIVLFQFKAHLIASAAFLRDEKSTPAQANKTGYGGTMFFDVASIRTFAPIDLATMRKSWPHFRAFGHVRQFLSADGYMLFKRRLKHVQSPPRSALPRRASAS
jgi:hypothetical protein